MAEWELSKENVEPIKEGRSIKSLRSALSLKDNQNDYEKRESIRKEFESELRTYSGSDPLSVYHKYIQWIEQNYPEGGNEANLKTVLESCIQQHYSSPVYCNDSRLLHIFLKFIKRVDSPLELFNFFHENGFGTQLSEFYINWSFHLENHKNTKKAVQVLRSGLEKGAQPMSSLERALQELEIRVAKAIAKGEVEDLNENTDCENQNRKPLNKLKEKCKKSKSEAPIKRVGNAVKNSKTGLKNVRETVVSNNLPKIYTDENDANINSKCVSKPGNGNEVKQISSLGQENAKKAEKWSENQIKQKFIKTNQKSGFAIHADNPEVEDVNTLKPPQSNTLKVRAHCSQSPPMAIFEKPDPFKRFMFNENKLYAGGEEFCFEEIRGRKWLSAKRREEEVIRSQKLEEEVAQLRRQVEQLLSAQHNIRVKQNEKPLSSPQVSSADSSNTKSVSNVSKGTLSMMRELWNGTLANNEMPENVQKVDKIGFSHMNEKTENDCKSDDKFLIYSDRTILSTSNQPIGRSNIQNNNMLDETGNVNFTIALPKSEEDFIACCSSTPMADRSKKFADIGTTQLLNNNMNFVSGMTAKLSPIVETSREYNSKSSSSSSGTMSIGIKRNQIKTRLYSNYKQSK